MPDPQIKYVRTSDGVNIAYFTMGEGDPPIVTMDVVYSNLQAEWSDPGQRRQYEAIARVTTLVRYDHRGFGLSDRDPAELSLDGYVLDLEAVAERVLPDRPFVLIAQRGVTTPIAVTYAVRHPERLTHLALATPMARVPAMLVERFEAIIDAPGADERFVSESIARLVQGWDDHDASQTVAAMMRESVSLQGLKRWLAEATRWDVSDLLPLVRTPTLLMPYKGHAIFGVEQAREVAALLPDSHMAINDGATSAERNAQTVLAIAGFLSAAAPPALVASIDAAVTAMSERPAAPVASGTAVILFTDIVDSTAITERIGDAAFRERSSKLDAAMRRAIVAAGGTAVDGKLLGDGVMAVFGAAREAIAAAIACNAAAADAGLELHLGIHAGDVIRDGGNVYGGAVNIASRISGLSAPAEVLVSDIVRGLARTSAGVVFEDRGEHVKGIADAVRVYAVRAGEA